MATKRRFSSTVPKTADDEDPIDPSDELLFVALGGGNEVGRSCHILQYKGKTVMLDAGVHPGLEGMMALPYYDEFDLSTVDVLLVTHFHMDHAASLPYVLAKTNFAGRCYMTHPTKAIYKHIVQDAVRVQNTHSSGTDGQVAQLFTEQDILSTLPLIQTISFYTTHTHNGIRFTPYPAGHVLGACMYQIEIAGLSILFTGDYSRENDRHLIPATIPASLHIDVLICESTFGISTSTPRSERETALMKSITSILNRGGRALLPVFAMGMAQELLLILEEYWQRHEEFRRFPIYYASNLARKCMVVYQTYIDAMNDNIKSKFQARMGEEGGGGPWDFRFIRSLKSLDRFDDVGGCVMLASPGMLQNGVSRALLERWAPDPKNGIVITGYSVEGTMAKQIMTEPEAIPSIMSNRNVGPRVKGQEENPMIPRRCSVQEFSFAAHVDGTENREFIEQVGAPVVILVHGEKHNMARLKSKLLSLNASKQVPVKVFSPVNCEELRIPFRQDKVAKVVGRLASQIQLPSPAASEEGGGEEKRARTEGQVVSGVLVQNDFKLSLMAPEDLKEYAGLTTTTILCRQRITLGAAGPELIKWALEGTFGSVRSSRPPHHTNGTTNGSAPKHESADEEPHSDTDAVFTVMGNAVTVLCKPRGEVEIEWEGNTANDSIADAVMAVLLSVETSPAAVKHSSKLHSHSHSPAKPPRNLHANLTPDEKLSRLFMFLESQFGENNCSPITFPRLSAALDLEDDDEVGLQKAQSAELQRLHGLGIPVPGVEVRIDKAVARVWLETLEVECRSKSVFDRVKVVVERAVETLAPLWE